MGIAEGIAPEVHQIAFGERFPAHGAELGVLFSVTLRMPGHALVFNILPLDHFSAAGAFQTI